MRTKNNQHLEYGRWAEAKAAAFLLELGYQIIAHNYRAGRGELDLVAVERDVLVFVEVRARRERDWLGAEKSIGPQKQKLLNRSALWFWTRERKLVELKIGHEISEIRFDAICFKGSQVFHIKGWKSGL